MERASAHHKRLDVENVAFTIASARKVGMVTHLKTVWSDFPTVKPLTVEVTNHFGELSVDGKLVLSSTAIRMACTAFRAHRKSSSEPTAQLHFLLALYRSFGEAARYRIRVGTAIWNPQVESFPKFSEKGEPCVERNVGGSANDLADGLMSLFLEKQVIKAIGRLERAE